VIAIDVRVAADTVLAFEVMPPEVAVMVVAVAPLTSSVANPELVIPTVAGTDEIQVTEEVMLPVVPSL
jgi:hypothetical protein